jgi:hypothetical protein
MRDSGAQLCPIAKIKGRLTRDEELIEIVRAERALSREPRGFKLPAKPEAIRRMVELGLKAKK